MQSTGPVSGEGIRALGASSLHQLSVRDVAIGGTLLVFSPRNNGSCWELDRPGWLHHTSPLRGFFALKINISPFLVMNPASQQKTA